MNYGSIVESTEVIIDFPYDLNNLFSLQYSFDVLKKSIEFLVQNQISHSKLFKQLQLESGGDHSQMSGLDKIMKELNRLNEKSQQHDLMNEQFLNLQNQVLDHENSITLIKSMNNLSNPDGKSGIIDALETLVENLRKECYA